MADQRLGKKTIYVIVENVGLYKKLHPKLVHCFDVTTEKLEDESNSEKRFDKKRRILKELKNFMVLFYKKRHYLEYDVIVCFARKRHLSYLIFVRIMKVFGVDIRLFMYGFYIQSWAMNPIVKYLMSVVLTENVGMLVISKTDMEFLQAVAPRLDVRYYPFCLAQRTPDELSIIELGDYVFSGGHTNRDYETLLECAENMPRIKFIVVWSQYTKVRHSIPANVKVYTDLEGPEFYRLLAKSRLVVIPLLKKGFSSGQTVATESMQCGKTTIYCDYENVSQYFDDGMNGILYVSGDARSLKSAISDVVEDEDRCNHIGQLARDKYYKYYTKDKLDDAIVKNVDDFSRKP